MCSPVRFMLLLLFRMLLQMPLVVVSGSCIVVTVAASRVFATVPASGARVAGATGVFIHVAAGAVGYCLCYNCCCCC